MGKPSLDSQFWNSFEFHSAGGTAELPRGLAETKVIDQSAPERKYADCAPKAHKQCQMWLAENNFLRCDQEQVGKSCKMIIQRTRHA